MQKAIDLFNAALLSPERMKRPSPRDVAQEVKAQRKGFKKHVKANAPKPVKPAPVVSLEFEPYVLTRGQKGGAKYLYQRTINGEASIAAKFRTREEANRFARAVNNIYKDPQK